MALVSAWEFALLSHVGTQLCLMRILIQRWGFHLSRATSGELNCSSPGCAGGGWWLSLRAGLVAALGYPSGAELPHASLLPALTQLEH